MTSSEKYVFALVVIDEETKYFYMPSVDSDTERIDSLLEVPLILDFAPPFLVSTSTKSNKSCAPVSDEVNFEKDRASFPTRLARASTALKSKTSAYIRTMMRQLSGRSGEISALIAFFNNWAALTPPSAPALINSSLN